MYRKVYLDFQDGSGFRDVSSYVKYDTLQVTPRAFSDNWHFAQNTASFSLIYDPVIYPLLRYNTKEIIVRIVDVYDESLILTENNYFLLTENAFYLARETDGFEPFFYGRIPPTKSRTYNGLLDNTFFDVEAVDELTLLDKAAGDVCYRDYQIMNPSDKTHSIVHQLAYLCGMTDNQIDPSIYISDIIEAFTPPDPNDLCKDLLDTLLFEYGWVLNMSLGGQISPLRWIQSGDTTFEFNETDIIQQIDISDTLKSYDGAEVVYYELGEAVTTEGNDEMLLYRDGELPYASDGSFAGYPIPNGFSYPPETNVIDETTGLDQIVYQEYDDNAVKYWTNKAIVERLDYNYKAFSSDFSAIVATSEYRVDWRGDAGLVLTKSVFENRRAELVIDNPTAEYLNLYYLNVYGKVLYKTAERKAIVKNVTTAEDLDKYVSTFIFSKTIADVLAIRLAKQHLINSTQYAFISEENRPVGEFVRVLLGDGTDQDSIITEKAWNEATEQFKYRVRAYSADEGTLTAQTYSANPVAPVPENINLTTEQNDLIISSKIDGSDPILTNAYFVLRVYRDGKDDTDGWGFSATPTNVTGSFGTGADINKWTVTGFAGAPTVIGSVDFTATRFGFTNRTLTRRIEKVVPVDGATVQSVMDAQGAAEDYADGLAGALQTEIDGKITCYYQATAPSTGMVDGDLWIDTDDGNNMYRYNLATTTWVDVQDTAIATAYNLASTKNTVWATMALANSGGAVIGDLFLDSSLVYRATVVAPGITIANSVRTTPKRYPDVADTTALNALTGMIANDTVFKLSEKAWYYYTTSWIVDGVALPSVVVTYAPKYLGRYDHAHPASTNVGDWWTVYHTDDTAPQRGVWWNNNNVYERITTSSGATVQAKFVEALTDVAWAESNSYGVAADYGIATLFQTLGVVTAFINELFTQSITVGTGGRIRYETGSGVQKRCVQLADEKIDWLDTPDTSPASPEQLRARIGRLGVGPSILMGGEFLANCEQSWSGESTISSGSIHSNGSIIEQNNGVLRQTYITSSGEIVYKTSLDGLSWSVASTIVPNTEIPSIARLIQRRDGSYFLAYVATLNTRVYVRDSDDGTTWSDFTLIDSTATNSLEVIEGDDEIIKMLRGDNNGLNYMTSSDGLTWDAAIELTDFYVQFPNLIQLNDGNLYAVYKRSTDDDLVYRKSADGITWDSPTVILESGVLETSYFTLCENLDGTLTGAYINNADADLYICSGTDIDSMFTTPSLISVGVYSFMRLLQASDATVYLSYYNNTNLVRRTLQRYALIGAGIISDTNNGTTRYLDFSNKVRLSFPLAGGTVTASNL